MPQVIGSVTKQSSLDALAAELRVQASAASNFLRGHVLLTPVRRLTWLERIVGVPVWVKLECWQYTGSFKYRGALYRLRNAAPNVHIIAASAGNHGLAIADVCQRLGVRVDICLPTSASRLKRERILAGGAGVIDVGATLDKAIENARSLAEERNGTFISPYDDADVIAANATVAIEFLEQVPELEMLIAPIGGGGLISGMGIGAELGASSPVRIVGAEPFHYDSMSRALRGEARSDWVPQPTLADGLAVGLDDSSRTIPLVRRYVDHIQCLTEEELAAGTLAVLLHESILVEPAGAAGIAACLRLSSQGLLKGPVGIPLCGGNLQHSALVRIQRFPYTDPALIRLLDLRGRQVADSVTRRSFLGPPPAVRSEDKSTQIAHTAGELHSECIDELGRVAADLREFSQYCKNQELSLEPTVISSLLRLAEEASRHIGSSKTNLEAANAPPWKFLDLTCGPLRWGMSTAAYLRSVLEWCSASYAQSKAAQFFDIGSQDCPGVNYDRYHAVEVVRVENQLADLFGLARDKLAVTVTSSGMAAYSLIESFLLRERLRAGHTVLVAPYIYFEAYEQLASLPHIVCEKAAGYDVDTLVRQVESLRPRVLVVDPLANTAEQRMIDIPELLTELRRKCVAPLTVVIDGTMVSGALPQEVLQNQDNIETIYYESASKYLQLGADSSMAGCVVHSVDLLNHFTRLRRNIGAILPRHGALLFPSYAPQMFRERMLRISRNAARICEILNGIPRVMSITDVVYPGHSSHIDNAIARRYPYAGGCVTFRMKNAGENHRDQLEAFIERVLHQCRTDGVPLTKGVSFGFAAPRISAAASMAETDPAFLRVYAGDQDTSETERLAEILAHTFAGSRTQG
jgi:threonine dehydratase